MLAAAWLAAPAGGQLPPVEIGYCARIADLPAVKAAGFAYAELRVSEVAALSEAEFDALAQRLKDLSIAVPVANVFLPGDLKLTGPDADEARQTSYVKKALERAAKLGITTVVFGSGAARSHPAGFPRAEAWRQLVGFGKRLGPEARVRGITIAVEPLRRQESNLVNSVAEGLELVQAVSDANFQLMVDFYHLAEEKEDPSILLKAKPHIRHLHMANPVKRVFPLRWEEFEYAPFFRTLLGLGQHWRMSVEASTTDFAKEAPQAIAFLREALTSGPPGR